MKQHTRITLESTAQRVLFAAEFNQPDIIASMTDELTDAAAQCEQITGQNWTQFIATQQDMLREDQEADMDTDYRLTTDDRLTQINWITELAADITFSNITGTPEELVDWTLQQMELNHEQLPEWFDDHDRQLLIDCVAES